MRYPPTQIFARNVMKVNAVETGHPVPINNSLQIILIITYNTTALLYVGLHTVSLYNIFTDIFQRNFVWRTLQLFAKEILILITNIKYWKLLKFILRLWAQMSRWSPRYQFRSLLRHYETRISPVALSSHRRIIYFNGVQKRSGTIISNSLRTKTSRKRYALPAKRSRIIKSRIPLSDKWRQIAVNYSQILFIDLRHLHEFTFSKVSSLHCTPYSFWPHVLRRHRTSIYNKILSYLFQWRSQGGD